MTSAENDSERRTYFALFADINQPNLGHDVVSEFEQAGQAKLFYRSRVLPLGSYHHRCRYGFLIEAGGQLSTEQMALINERGMYLKNVTSTQELDRVSDQRHDVLDVLRENGDEQAWHIS